MATGYLRIRLEGSMGSSDTWSVNPAFSYPAGSVPTQTAVDDWTDAVAALNSGGVIPSSLAGRMDGKVKITKVRGEYYGTAGTLLVVSEHVFTSPVTTGTGNGLPPQCAVVTSLLTGIVGRRTRGRLYWPLLGVGTTAPDGRLDPSVASSIATQTAAWLQAVEGAWTPESIRSCVVSKASGTDTAVTSVRVGDVIDTQRRRRNKEIENYSSAPLT